MLFMAMFRGEEWGAQPLDGPGGPWPSGFAGRHCVCLPERYLNLVADTVYTAFRTA